VTQPPVWRVYAALVVASLLWGSLYTAAKPAVEATGPMQVTLCRVALAFLCLAPIALARGGANVMLAPLRSHWRAVVLLGVLNFAGSQILALNALVYLPASVNGVLNNTHPLWVAIGTALIFRMQRSKMLVVGSLVALLGVFVIFAPDVVRTNSVRSISPIGVVLSLAGSGVIAIGTVLGRRIMPGNDPLAVSSLASAAALIPVIWLTLANGGLQPIVEADNNIKALLVYVGVGCTAINFALWYYGLKHMSAAGASAFQYLIPPIGVALAAIVLGEPVTFSLLLGTVCILVGLAATQLAVEAPVPAQGTVYSGTKRSFD
jgi:drug/metabolite transporter (DMT)-like permease